LPFLFFIHAAFIIPLWAGTFAIGVEFQHALTALQLDVGCVAIALFDLFLGQDLRKTASALGAGGFDVITLMTHGCLPVIEVLRKCVNLRYEQQYQCHQINTSQIVGTFIVWRKKQAFPGPETVL
jgi:hypothetical protein